MTETLTAKKLTVDIGAGDGEFSRRWQTASPSERHIALDLWQPQTAEAWPHFDNQPDPEYWKELYERCRSRSQLESPFEMLQTEAILGASQFEDDSVDALWIDASHNYGFIADLLEAWWPKIRPGGIVGGASWINQFHRLDNNGTMWLRSRQAVTDFARRQGRHIYTDQEQWPCYLFTKEPTTPKVTVVSGSTSDIPWIEVAQQNHRDYCEKHNFSYQWFNFDNLDRHPVWGKIFALVRSIETTESDWILWLDSDAIFVDFSKSIREFLISGLDAILPEWGGQDNLCRPSSGVMIWRANQRTQELLKKVWQSPGDKFKPYGGEEDALYYVPQGNPELSSRCLLVDHRHFNSMMSSSIGWYDERDFIIHIGQVSNPDRHGVISDLAREAKLRDSRPYMTRRL